MNLRIEASDKKHPDELPLDETTRPGPRSWGKLHHLLRRVRFVRHQALSQILTQRGEDRGQKTKGHEDRPGVRGVQDL